MTYIYLFLSGLVLSLIFTPLSRKIAWRLEILDHPAERKIHRKKMPLLGGLAIFLAFNLAILLNMGFLILASKGYGLKAFIPGVVIDTVPGLFSVWQRLGLILFGGLLIFLVGLTDDVRKVPAKIKLISQIIVGLILFFAGIRVVLFTPNLITSCVVTVLWIVGITNAFNLLDNMDGLSCGVALIASLIFFIISMQSGQLFVSSMLVVFMGALLGFLRYNFNPASIFMGDAGSLFIGYILSVLTIMSTYYTETSPTLMPILMPLLILSIPVFDTASVILIRIRKRLPVFAADKNHFSHRLMRLGMTQRQAVTFIYLLSFCIGLGALLLRYLSFTGSMIVLIQSVCILAVVVFLERTNHGGVE